MESGRAGPRLGRKGYTWRTDLSFWSLLLTNLALIGVYLYQQMSFFEVVWIFWFQSVIIGFFTFLYMLSLKDYSTKGVVYYTKTDYGLRKKAHPIKSTTANKIFLACFFLFHYGFFHVVYMEFLIGLDGSAASPFDYLLDPADPSGRMLGFSEAVGLFLINHFFSFVYNMKRKKTKENIGDIFIAPYERIVPMHVTIFFGGLVMMLTGSGQALLIFFLLVKTAADLCSHATKHGDHELDILEKYARIRSRIDRLME